MNDYLTGIKWCPITASASVYVGAVIGWKEYDKGNPRDPGIHRYEGLFEAFTGGVTLPFGVVSGQGFISADRKMKGATLGIGIGNDKLPFGVSKTGNYYSPPIPITKLEFHRRDRSGRAIPPTKLETELFVLAVSLTFNQPPTQGFVPLVNQIIRDNARIWNEEYYKTG